MIRPEDLQNRAVFETPADRGVESARKAVAKFRALGQEPPAQLVELAAEETDEEHAPSAPGDPCPPSQPAALEHGERTGGNPDKAGE